MSKVTQFPGTKPGVPLKEAMVQLVKDLPDMIEYYAIRAKLQKAYYDALIKEGFTKQEALELCKQIN